jgi:chromatin remodeling complex protein RSC6
MPPTTKPNKKVSKPVKKTSAPKNAGKAKKVVTAPKPAAPATPASPATETPVTPAATEAPVQTEAPVVSDTPYLSEFTAVVGALDEAMNTIRSLKARVQKLEKQVHRDHKVTAKKLKGKGPRKPRDPNAPKSGFAKDGPISPEMGKFLGLKKDELISRTDVTKRIHQYCKAKDLQNPADKRHIKADAPLRKLLKMSKDDDLTFFNLQKFMKVHFPNKEGVYPTA